MHKKNNDDPRCSESDHELERKNRGICPRSDPIRSRLVSGSRNLSLRPEQCSEFGSETCRWPLPPCTSWTSAAMSSSTASTATTSGQILSLPPSLPLAMRVSHLHVSIGLQVLSPLLCINSVVSVYAWISRFRIRLWGEKTLLTFSCWESFIGDF